MKLYIKISSIFFFILFVSKIQSQQLEAFIGEALANNPEIQKFELQYSIASEKINEVNTLPNTEFGVG